MLCLNSSRKNIHPPKYLQRLEKQVDLCLSSVLCKHATVYFLSSESNDSFELQLVYIECYSTLKPGILVAKPYDATEAEH